MRPGVQRGMGSSKGIDQLGPFNSPTLGIQESELAGRINVLGQHPSRRRWRHRPTVHPCSNRPFELGMVRHAHCTREKIAHQACTGLDKSVTASLPGQRGMKLTVGQRTHGVVSQTLVGGISEVVCARG